MAGVSKYDQHADLVRRMAGALGADLDLAEQSGRMPPEDLHDTVQRCIGCREPGACQEFLVQNDGQRMDAAPDYCRNADLLQALVPR